MSKGSPYSLSSSAIFNGRNGSKADARPLMSEMGGKLPLARAGTSLHHRPMIKLSLFAAVVICGLFLAGCVQLSISDPPLVVNVKSNGDQCLVTVAPNAFTLPLVFSRVTQEQLLQLARQAKSRRGIVVSDVNAQYKCMGAAISTLQQAGLTVDFAPWDSR